MDGRSSWTSGADQNPPSHEIGKIGELSMREGGIGGPVPKDLADYITHFLADVMP